MTNKLTLVTAPDDILEDGLRILLVGLDHQNSERVSTALTRLDSVPTTIIYVWNKGEDRAWLFDKKQKSNIIIFDADNVSPEMMGYMAAQPNSYYFGILREIEPVNNRALFDVDTCYKLLGEIVDQYERQYTQPQVS